MKIFYSWQTDAPRKINKNFIYNALRDAIRKLGEELDLTEPERDGIILDQDTAGVLGSPEIARVIFEKIAAARVVVTDVSLVAEGNEGKRHINSNVAIELGYAYGKVSDFAVLKVMNTYFGPPDKLPFDLRIRRHPVQYRLAPDADAAAIARESKKLTNALTSILKQYLEREPSPLVSAAHVETPSVGLRGRYWEPTDVLIPTEGNPYIDKDIFCASKSLLYFRCIPNKELPALSSRDAYDLAADLRPLVSNSGHSRSRNKWGAISHSQNLNRTKLMGAAQLLRNREIWGIDAEYSEAKTRPEDEDEDPKRIIPTGAVNRYYPRAIDSMRQLASTLGYGDRYTIEMGFSGAKGVYLAINRDYFESYPGPIHMDEVYIRKVVDADHPTGEIMNAFWDQLFSEAGRQVPDELLWQQSE